MGRFETTRWSLVLSTQGDPARARAALERLCRIYRPAVLAYVRRQGYATEQAEDLTQGFFVRFLEQASFARADPQRGRFRAYLLTALRRHLINAADSAHAARRSGDAAAVAYDAVEDTTAMNDDDPLRAFERGWALAVLGAALARLREEAARAGKLDLYEQLHEFLTERPGEADYARVAAALGLRPNTLAVAVHRMRHRLRELVRAELAETTGSEGDLEQEIADLRAALGATLH